MNKTSITSAPRGNDSIVSIRVTNRQIRFGVPAQRTAFAKRIIEVAGRNGCIDKEAAVKLFPFQPAKQKACTLELAFRWAGYEKLPLTCAP